MSSKKLSIIMGMFFGIIMLGTTVISAVSGVIADRTNGKAQAEEMAQTFISGLTNMGKSSELTPEYASQGTRYNQIERITQCDLIHQYITKDSPLRKNCATDVKDVSDSDFYANSAIMFKPENIVVKSVESTGLDDMDVVFDLEVGGKRAKYQGPGQVEMSEFNPLIIKDVKVSLRKEDGVFKVHDTTATGQLLNMTYFWNGGDEVLPFREEVV